MTIIVHLIPIEGGQEITRQVEQLDRLTIRAVEPPVVVTTCDVFGGSISHPSLKRSLQLSSTDHQVEAAIMAVDVGADSETAISFKLVATTE
ncbi:hypothetical protein A2160_04155 [Candidatus Beckwithbacteria bacterium RBG_13_42_9]|uniref:Uncharacterized protein n=1 Tax=Candidatus Beckwithbacteria bacterium RBG_13_42_9 TaxID=1797457 RepID=A0A1F5E6B1_9BACT|nr:MAG: hypothetical protein A2160_04155 [Candidatus Beckwithbacteria bacterium RBG_13_42_9]